MPIIPALGRLRKVDLEFGGQPGYIGFSLLKKKVTVAAMLGMNGRGAEL
jgi:hypothetical protein